MSALLPAPIIRKPPKRSRAQTAEEQLEESRILRRVESAFEAAFAMSRGDAAAHARRVEVYRSVVDNVLDYPDAVDGLRNPRRLRLDKLRRALPGGGRAPRAAVRGRVPRARRRRAARGVLRPRRRAANAGCAGDPRAPRARAEPRRRGASESPGVMFFRDAWKRSRTRGRSATACKLLALVA